MVIEGKVTCNWTACLRSFCAAIRISAAFLRSASESMGGFLGRVLFSYAFITAINDGLPIINHERHTRRESDWTPCRHPRSKLLLGQAGIEPRTRLYCPFRDTLRAKSHEQNYNRLAAFVPEAHLVVVLVPFRACFKMRRSLLRKHILAR